MSSQLDTVAPWDGLPGGDALGVWGISMALFLLMGPAQGNCKYDKGHLQLESYLHASAGPAKEGRHSLEKKRLSALPNNSTLVSLKAFLIVPARKQKYYPASPKNLIIKMTFLVKVGDPQLWRNLRES